MPSLTFILLLYISVQLLPEVEVCSFMDFHRLVGVKTASMALHFPYFHREENGRSRARASIVIQNVCAIG